MTHAEDLRFKACQRQRGSRSCGEVFSRTGPAQLRLQAPPGPGGGALGSTRGRGGPCLLGAEGQGMDDKRCLPGSRSEAHWDQRRIRGLAKNHDLRGCLAGLQGLGWARYSWSHNKQASL